MTDKENLRLAIAEAIRFVDKAVALKDTNEPTRGQLADLKRSSLDLSYALITLRKEGMNS
jgi:hypothetical protein